MEKKTINLIVSVLFVFAIFLFSYLYRKHKNNDIEAHSKFTIGRIFKFTTSLKSGNAWHYKFKYKDNWYENYRSTHVDYDVNMGDFF